MSSCLVFTYQLNACVCVCMCVCVHVPHWKCCRDVRKAVLSHIIITRRTLKRVLERIRDVNDDVRKHAFHVLAHKVPFKALSISQRNKIIRSGLRDRNPSVRKSALDLVHMHWLKGYGMELLPFLKAIDFQEYEEEAGIVLEALFERVIPKDALDLHELSSEKVLCLRCYYEFLSKQDDDSARDRMDVLIQDVGTYVDAMTRCEE
jgi:hypothetical protein